MNEDAKQPLWLVVRLRRTLLGNRYRYWGTYDSEAKALNEANGRNYRGTGYLNSNEKFLAFRVELTLAEEEVLRSLSEGQQEHSILRFGPDAWN